MCSGLANGISVVFNPHNWLKRQWHMAQYFDRFYSILKLYAMNYRASDGLMSIEMLYVFKTHKAQARHAILFLPPSFVWNISSSYKLVLISSEKIGIRGETCLLNLIVWNRLKSYTFDKMEMCYGRWATLEYSLYVQYEVYRKSHLTNMRVYSSIVCLWMYFVLHATRKWLR